MSEPVRHPASFRDPSGFLFLVDGNLHRQIDQSYANDYDRLMQSGLYDDLVGKGYLIPYSEVALELTAAPNAYRVIRPESIPFISYPYEWSFSQLKDAALLTLQIQQIALQYGMSLKDASAYNIQYRAGRPALIDTLSFEAYSEGEPWVAYRQFCQHFLAPLALASFVDVDLLRLTRLHIDGIPLELARKALPKRTYWRIPLLLHLHLHAKAQERYADAATVQRRRKINKTSLLGIIDSLESGVRKLTWAPGKTEWGEYYTASTYTPEAFAHKKILIRELLDSLPTAPGIIWDLGANVGVFSRIAAEGGAQVISCDIDPACVEHNYSVVAREGEGNILPLRLDLTNPSPAIGWEHRERSSLVERAPADLVMALALVHHLAISNNVPLSRIAGFFARLSAHLIIEFVPKQDSQVQRLLASRRDIFPDYTQLGFEEAFGRYFSIKQAIPIRDTARILYYFVRD